MRALPFVVGLGIMFGAVSSAGAGPSNLVTNGSFEQTTTVAGSGWTTGGAFISEGYDFMVDTDPTNAQQGNASFAGGAIGGYGYLSQTIATTAGANYDIRLWLANPSGFADGTAFQVLWNGAELYSLTDITSAGYTEITLNAMATAPSTTLSLGLRDDSFFLNVDSVAVSTVPEPSTAALLFVGLSCVLARRRSRGIAKDRSNA